MWRWVWSKGNTVHVEMGVAYGRGPVGGLARRTGYKVGVYAWVGKDYGY